ncbi:MAG: Hsp20/alpha crystallin family protein [Actinomycetota bacterium]|nr:Hsp20/alpha crystallin family protein [Actinomycetota bacterium]
MAMSPFRGRGFWDPLSEMNRMFDDVFGGLARRPGGRQQGGEASQWSPALDVISENGDILVRAELPGVKPEDVDITLSRGVLTISGQRQAEQERQGAGYYVRERRHGSFRRSMQLPEGVDESSISARFENGVLELRIAGAAAVQEPKRIQIESSGTVEGDVGTPTVTAGEPGVEAPRTGEPGAEGPEAEGPEGPGGTVR